MEMGSQMETFRGVRRELQVNGRFEEML